MVAFVSILTVPAIYAGTFQSGSKFSVTELGANFNRILISE
jgi:hypothetical protein